ncbi:MAG: Fe-S cluster assembly protein HesB [Cryobacterium sp.]|nr:Fe-S cluster assembly protein HesB [Cryobacterium sp.]
MAIHLTGNDSADQLLTDNPFALLVGMLLDQQVPMETAFSGPAKLLERIGKVDAAVFAKYDPDEFVKVFQITPAVHRFPGAMAARVQSLAEIVQNEWNGDAAAIWTSGSPDGKTVLARLKKLPGFGEQKAAIFLALLGKQCGLKAEGWREASGQFGKEGTFVSVADIRDSESLAKVREHKKAMKAAAKKG